MNIPLSPCVPENFVLRDGFSRLVPRQPAHLHTQAESGAYLLRDSSRVPRRRPFMKPPYTIGSVPSLSGHAIAYRWRSLSRGRRHRASKPQDSSERVLDSGGEKWAELSALKMKWIESTQGKILRSSFLHFVHHANRACAETQTRSRSTYLLAKTPPPVMCVFFTHHLGPHIYLNVKCLFFEVLLLHAPLINPAVLLLALH